LRPEILGKFGDILEKIGGFQYLQRFLRQVLKNVAMKEEYRRVFAEESTLSLAGALNPILLANKVEVERLIQLAEAEKEKALLEKIGYVVGHHGLDPATSMIGTRSADILKMNVFQRHSTVADIYEKKLAPFGELYGRADFHVIATVEDLQSVKSYKDGTLIGAESVHPGPREIADTPWARALEALEAGR
jgi:hypothetical protein